jgi:hypothetical protein
METVLKDREAMIALYAPYCEGFGQPQLLDLALNKLNNKRLNGSRRLKPDGSHPFELIWEPGESPQEPSPCQLNFPETPAVTYRFSVPTAQLVLWLMQILQSQTSPGLLQPPNGNPAAPTLPTLPGVPAPPLPGVGLTAMPPPPLPFATPTQAPVPAASAPGALPGPLPGPADLPESFWRWLLVGDIATDSAA